MLETILGSKSKEQILIYLTGRKQGYAREIANYYDTALSPLQKQLDKLEQYGILYVKFIGRTKVFSINPRYPFFQELNQLLQKAITFLPNDEKQRLLFVRKRPRRTGKPL